MSVPKEPDMQAEFAPKARSIRKCYKVIEVGLLFLTLTLASPAMFELIDTPVVMQMILVAGGTFTFILLASPSIWIRYWTKCPNCSGRLFLDESRTFQLTGKCGFCGAKLHKDGDVTGWNKYFK